MLKQAGNEVITAELSTYKRYSAAAQQVDPALCCPVNYPPALLVNIPDEVVERDYGCGDPSPYVRPGDTVLDLGSGGGKLCFIAAQLVGRQGKVIGVDCNREMLDLARRNTPLFAQRIGFNNVEFRYGLIQDLQLNLQLLEAELAAHPVSSAEGYFYLRQLQDRLRKLNPLIESESIDCALSNCVLNLVSEQDRQHLFTELFRVIKRGGRVAISDIVCDQDVPEHLKNDRTHWSGCLSGAYREDRFLEAFEIAGFHGIEITKWSSKPWQTIEGLEFRSITVTAYKGKHGDSEESNQAVIYRGPFKAVIDDDGHTYQRGKRTPVCNKTFQLLNQPPYAKLFEPIASRATLPLQPAAGNEHCEADGKCC